MNVPLALQRSAAATQFVKTTPNRCLVWRVTRHRLVMPVLATDRWNSVGKPSVALTSIRAPISEELRIRQSIGAALLSVISSPSRKMSRRGAALRSVGMAEPDQIRLEHSAWRRLTIRPMTDFGF